MSYQHILDDLNYYADPRVRAKERGDWFHTILDPFTVVIDFYDENGDCEDRKVRVTRAVCPTCDGIGHHVNPSIDSGGLSAGDFDDHDFEESYHHGHFDVSCYECHGNKVILVPHPDHEKEVIAYLDQQARDEYDSFLERQSERRFGC